MIMETGDNMQNTTYRPNERWGIKKIKSKKEKDGDKVHSVSKFNVSWSFKHIL